MKQPHRFQASYVKFIDKLIQLFSELTTTTTTTHNELGLDRPSSASSNSLCGPGEISRFNDSPRAGRSGDRIPMGGGEKFSSPV